MNKIKKILFAVILLVCSAFMINVDATSIKENKPDIEKSTTDVYLIGGTKFHSNYQINAGESAEAGANYIYLQLAVYNKKHDELDRKPKVIYYSSLTKGWYIKSSGELNKIDTEEELELLEDNLVTFFENNEEKIIEFDPGVAVDQSKYSKELYEELGVEYDSKSKTFKVPATVTNFSFLSNYNQISVSTNYNSDNKEVEYGELYIPKYVSVYDYNDKDAVLTQFDDDPNNDIYDINQRNSFSTNTDGKIIFHDESELYYSNDDKAVVKYVDEDGNDIDVLSMTFDKEHNIVYQVLEDGIVGVNNVNYTLANIDKAFAQSDELSPVYLLKDTTITDRINLELSDQDVYFNTYSYTLSCEKECFRITGKNSTFNVVNGNFQTTTPAAQVFTLGKNKETSDQNLKLVVNRSVTINAKGHGIVLFGNGTVLDFYGNIIVDTENLDTTGIYGITGNGIPENGGTEINIYGGTINTNGENTVALYLPQHGVVNIDKYVDEFNNEMQSTLSGETAIGIKSGELNINNAYLVSTISAKEPVLYNNGIYSTGDVIYAELNGAYADNIKINIGENVYLTSYAETDPGHSLLVYNPNNLKYPEITFETSEEDPYYNKYVKLIDGDKTYYTYESNENIDILVGDVGYKKDSLKEAILASSENTPAKLMKNINIADRINLELNGQDVYLDLNNWELSCGKECIRTTGENSSLSISNGTLTTSVEGGQALTIGKYRETTYKKMTLNLSNDVTINAIGHGIAVLGNGSILNSAANINVDTLETDLTGIYGITGNGLDNDGTTINITGGIIRTRGTNTAALYLPQLGITKVENATLEGESAIGIKSGTLEIKNSYLYATVAKRDPNSYNNGIYPTGDVIFVELNKNYKDNVEISITDSDLSSIANIVEGESFGEAILIYNPEDMDEISITAPDYSTKIIKENGKKVYYQFTENALMTVGNVGYTFENFQEAIDASTEETPLILKNDYVISAEETLNIGSGKSFKTDNGVTLTVQGTLNMTSDAIIDLKLEMNGGTVISGGVPITGPENSAYITSNATYYLDTNRNIDVLSGNVILGMSFNTMAGQTLIIKNGATFEIPEGKTLNLYSDLTIEDGATFIVNGTMNIYEGGKVTGNYTTGENGKVETVTN